MPQRGSMPVIGLPRNVTSPLVGCVKPANMLSMVDLPHPEAPSRQTNSPSSTDSERSLTATTSGPRPTEKIFVT